MSKDRICKQCKEPHDIKTVARVYGEESAVYAGGFCSAGCYTKYATKKTLYIPINWLPVGEFLPESTKKGFEATSVRGTSDRVLIFCNDNVERFGRYIHGQLNRWNVEGCAGQSADFVTHFAYLKEPE